MRIRSAPLHAALVCACAIVSFSCRGGAARPTDVTRAAQALGSAAFEPNLGAPACLEVAPGCSSGVLLAGPDAAGPESNAPNVIGPACPEQPWAGFSVEAIDVASRDGTPLSESAPVDVEVTISGAGVAFVQLWVASDALVPAWRAVHADLADLGAGSEAVVRITLEALDHGALQALRAAVGPATATDCEARTDTDDLAFLVAPPRARSPLLLASPADGAVVTGDVQLAIGQVGFPVVVVEYFVDDAFLVSGEPPAFRAVWPTVPSTEPRPAIVRANVHGAEWWQSGYAEVSVTVATSAACDLAGGNPICWASTASCGSGRGLQGGGGAETCGYEPWYGCPDPSNDGSQPFVDHLVVRSRDGAPLGPGVHARIDVDLGGLPDDLASRPGLALDVYHLDDMGAWTLLQTIPVLDGARRTIDFQVPPPMSLRPYPDPVSLHWVRAVLRDGGEPFACDPSVLDDDVLGFAAPDDVPPTVALTVLPEGAAVRNPVALFASARDASGIDRVTFLADGAEIAPFWRTLYEAQVDLPPGSHDLSVEAYDRFSNRAATAPISVYVDNAPPVVALTRPPPGATLHGIVDVVVDAADDFRVAAVEIEVDGRDHGLIEVPPWTFPWDTTRFASGTHALRAIAVDAAGWRSETPETSVTVDQLPSVQLVAPFDGQQADLPFAATFAAVATDDGAIAQVEFLVDGVPVATLDAPPYEIPWAPPTPGTYRVSARACDAVIVNPLAAGAAPGQCVTTPEARITFARIVPVDDGAPAVSLTSPSSGASVTGVVTLAASASDDVGVTAVSFKANGTIVGSDGAAPWSVTWDSTPYQGQSVTLLATAADAAGNLGTSAAVSVLVPDVTPPEVAITSPAADATLFKTAELRAAASDNVAVARVEYYADGELIGAASQPPFDLVWNVRKVQRGAHTLGAQALDAAGNLSTSREVRVYVK